MQPVAWRNAGQFTLVLLIPVCAFLTAHGTGFNGLADPAAMHDAELARSIATGKGFCSRAVTPLRLLFDADPPSLRKADVSTPPMAPAFMATIFALFGPSDEAAALSSGIAYVVSVAVTFLLLLRLASWGEAVLGAASFALALSVLRQAVSGTHALLATCLLGGAFLLLLHLTSADDAPDEPPTSHPDTAVALATGATFGLACLTEFYLAPLLLPIAAFVRLSDRRRARRRIGYIVLGAVLIVGGWLGRNARAIQMPLFSMRQYDLVAGTWTYPGRTVFQTLDPDVQWPPLFALGHPKEMARKVIYSFADIRQELPVYGDSVLAAIFLGGLLLPFGKRRTDALRLCLFGAVLLQSLVGGTLTRSVAMFLPLMPLGWALALMRLTDLVRSIAAQPWWATAAVRTRALHAGAAAGLIAAVAWPSLAAVVARAPLTLPSGPSTAFIAGATLPHEFVMTDVPQQVAWQADRTAIELVRTEAELTLAARIVPLGGLYLSRDPAEVPPQERSRWWQMAYGLEGPYMGTMWRAPGAPPGATWRRRLPGPADEGTARRAADNS